jgi:hypothetical protein
MDLRRRLKPSNRRARPRSPTGVATWAALVAAGGLAGCTPRAGAVDAGPGPDNCIPDSGDRVCHPDPGSKPVNCADEEANLEFAPFKLADFEGSSYLYSYTDGTAGVTPTGYQPPPVVQSRCSGTDPQNHVLHITGGPFLGWGGGMGVAIEHLNQDAGLCTTANQNSPNRPSYCLPPTAESEVAYAAMDVSQWDGVAVWARRGPDSQPLMRVLVGNKYTDDDIAFLMYSDNKPVYCRRYRICDCENRNTQCNLWSDATPGVATGGGYYCGDPANDPPPGTILTNGSTATNTCNTTRCNDIYPAYQVQDPEFYGRPCTPYASRSGIQVSMCWDPVGDPGDPGDPNANPPRPARAARAPDPPPPQPGDDCGDHWTFPISLTTDWKLYKIPFSEMYQQGFAKKWPFFDLTSVSVVRLTWDAGYIDYWVDDLRFYRTKRP